MRLIKWLLMNEMKWNEIHTHTIMHKQENFPKDSSNCSQIVTSKLRVSGFHFCLSYSIASLDVLTLTPVEYTILKRPIFLGNICFKLFLWFSKFEKAQLFSVLWWKLNLINLWKKCQSFVERIIGGIWFVQQAASNRNHFYCLLRQLLLLQMIWFVRLQVTGEKWVSAIECVMNCENCFFHAT